MPAEPEGSQPEDEVQIDRSEVSRGIEAWARVQRTAPREAFASDLDASDGRGDGSSPCRENVAFLESRMRENRTYGSEGGAGRETRPYP
jgi:hypothetical protein